MRLSKDQLLPFIEKFSSEYDVEANLIFAIIMAESGADPLAVRYEDHWKYFVSPDKFAKKCKITETTERQLQKMSFGLCQIMGGRAREIGLTENILTLCYPQVGIKYGTKNLSILCSKYNNLEDVIVSYNAGSPRKKQDGSYVNNSYLLRVMEFYKRGL